MPPDQKHVSTEPSVKIALIIWTILLLPWLLFAGMSGMAFDNGPTPAAYCFLRGIWTYPCFLGAAIVFQTESSGFGTAAAD